DRATFDLALHGPADAHKFCVQEGWFANALPTRGLSLPVVEPVIRLLFELGEYPVRWTHVIESVLAQHQPPPPTPHM
nr:hypothetical protein [Deltaproteobacteria bacterium]